MQQLMFEAAGDYAWRQAPEPEITAAEQAIVRPLAVACCDLDVAVAQGRLACRGALPLGTGRAGTGGPARPRGRPSLDRVVRRGLRLDVRRP